MSLIKCPECGQDVSDKAKVCPHCGYELSAAPPNVSVPQEKTEAETAPFAEPTPSASAPQAAAPVPQAVASPQTEMASQPSVTAPSTGDGSSVKKKKKKSVLVNFINDIIDKWKKECRGEYIFGVVVLVLGCIGAIICFGLGIGWAATVGKRWIFDFHLEAIKLIYCASDLKKTRNMAVSLLSFGFLTLFSFIFDDFWRPYRAKAWAKRKGYNLEVQLREKARNMTKRDKEGMEGDAYLASGMAIFLAIAYDRSPVGYTILNIFRRILHAVMLILAMFGFIGEMHTNMEAALLQTALPIPLRVIIFVVLVVLLGIIGFVLRKVSQRIVKGYCTALTEPPAENYP